MPRPEALLSGNNKANKCGYSYRYPHFYCLYGIAFIPGVCYNLQELKTHITKELGLWIIRIPY
jgi:hypothetical protein